MIMLVVDDDRLNLRVAEDLLYRLYPESKVLLCQDPLEVPGLLARNEVDLLFLDIVMPGKSGMEVLADIRADNRYNDMPIIMLTSMTDMAHFNTCFELGANDYLSKPINVEKFQARLKASVQMRGRMKLISEMYRQVKAQNSELRQLNAQLNDAQFHMVQQEKLASIGELAAGIAHEINNPIGFVSSNIDTLQKFFRRLTDVLSAHQQCMAQLKEDACTPACVIDRIAEIEALEQARKIPYVLSEFDACLEDTRDGTERVTKIVKTLRNFARSGLEDEIATCSLDEIVEEALLIVRNESKYSIDIHHERGDCGELLCNQGQIGQVVLNLLVNAIQASKGQSRDTRGNITLRTIPDEKGITLTVEDDGPGIPEENKARIFDPFFTTTDVGQGTGLGLSISHDIVVNKHKGNMLVEDNPTGGTRFIVWLPYRRMEAGDPYVPLPP